GAEIGCALMETATNRKVDLSPYKDTWRVLDENGAAFDVQYTDGQPSDPYHRRFVYTDDSYEKHTLKLRVEAASGRAQEYARPLGIFDEQFDQVVAAEDGVFLHWFRQDQSISIPLQCTRPGSETATECQAAST